MTRAAASRLRALGRLARNPTELWLRYGARRELRGLPRRDFWETRRAVVQRLAPGRSFLDLGGMFSVAGDVAFWAEEAGATEVGVFDAMDPTPEFARKHAERGSKVTYRQADLHERADVEAAGQWDVVWCTGVIYHSPDPYRQLLHLRQLTREWLYLGSHVVPAVPGIENACVFYPNQSDRALDAFAHFHGADAHRYPGATHPFDASPNMGYANMWWGFSPSALRALVKTAGFEIEEETRYTRVLMDILATPGPEPDFIPPPGFSRARGTATVAALPPDERPDWWIVPPAS